MTAEMRTMLMQLLAAKSGIDPETLTDPGGSTAGLDPTLSAFLTAMQQRDTARKEETRDNDDDDEDDGPVEHDTRLRLLLIELNELRRRSNAVSAALGACNLCWGRDPACVQCLGAGRPGWDEPHPELFRRLVGPAIRRRRELAPPPSPRPQPTSRRVPAIDDSESEQERTKP